MSQSGKQVRYYREFVEDLNRLVLGDCIDDAFTRFKTYLYKNFPTSEADIKNHEIVNYQSHYSRVRSSQRQGVIGVSEFNQEINKITRNILEFAHTLKPDYNDQDDLILVSEIRRESWNYQDNTTSVLVFNDDFGLLHQIFKKFKAYCKDKDTIRTNRYFFNGERKILIDDGKYASLDDAELREVVSETMEWSDAIIIQKKNINGFVIAEGFIQKNQEKEEIIVRTSGEDIIYRVELMREVIEYFRKVDYHETVKAPFYVHIPFSSLDIIYIFENDKVLLM